MPTWLPTFLLPAGVLYLALPLWPLGPWEWHDQQRLGQTVLACVAAAWLCAVYQQAARLPAYAVGGLGVLLGLGALSAGWAQQPVWAYTELALLVGGMGALAWATATACKICLWRVEAVLATLLAGAASAQALQFAAAYVAALLSPEFALDPLLMVSGFSNIRFQGQFLTLALPLVLLALVAMEARAKTTSAPPAHAGRTAPVRWLPPRWVCQALWLLPVWLWMMLLAVGTRGSWLGLLGASAVLLLYPAARPWAWRMLACALAAAAVTLVLFHLLPLVLQGQSALGQLQRFGSAAALAQTLGSSSGRTLLWALAAQAAAQQPLLGIGPMHFALLPEATFAAHPHNVVMQLAAEWGLPATAVALGLAGWLAWRLHQHLLLCVRCLPVHGGHALAAGATPGPQPAHGLPSGWVLPVLAMSLLGFALQSLVDGTWVMPYTQTTAALLLGWLWARMQGPPVAALPIAPHLGPCAAPKRTAARVALALAWVLCSVSAATMAAVAVRDFAFISGQRSDLNATAISGTPRYWVHGQFDEWQVRVAQPAADGQR